MLICFPLTKNTSPEAPSRKPTGPCQLSHDQLGKNGSVKQAGALLPTKECFQGLTGSQRSTISSMYSGRPESEVPCSCISSDITIMPEKVFQI